MKHLSGKIPQIHCCIVEVFTQYFLDPKLPERKFNTMHEHQQNQRIAAKRAFTESLNQLQDILLEEQLAEAEAPPTKDPANHGIDAEAWEEAAADIDQFFGDVPSDED
ncbi:MAG: hypothetical protein WBG73_17045 [Coleofasciculaceae cyanobacterium]